MKLIHSKNKMEDEVAQAVLLFMTVITETATRRQSVPPGKTQFSLSPDGCFQMCSTAGHTKYFLRSMKRTPSQKEMVLVIYKLSDGGNIVDIIQAFSWSFDTKKKKWVGEIGDTVQ